jgi:hypothetical protein
MSFGQFLAIGNQHNIGDEENSHEVVREAKIVASKMIFLPKHWNQILFLAATPPVAPLKIQGLDDPSRI